MHCKHIISNGSNKSASVKDLFICIFTTLERKKLQDSELRDTIILFNETTFRIVFAKSGLLEPPFI